MTLEVKNMIPKTMKTLRNPGWYMTACAGGATYCFS